MGVLRAVIYVLGSGSLGHGGSVAARVAQCGAYCAAAGYTVVAVFIGDRSGRCWQELRDMVWAGGAEIVVAPSPDDMPDGRTPRLEFAEDAPREVTEPSDHRPRRARRLPG